MRRALLVEDSSFFVCLFLYMLRSLGYAVEVHRGAKGARSACAVSGLAEDSPTKTRFDLYVVDISIQESEAGGIGDGLDFVRWLGPKHLGAKIIVCTADADRENEATTLGCSFVIKGPELDRRMKEVVGLLEQRG
jgi:CheY-like chemotaxis protein